MKFHSATIASLLVTTPSSVSAPRNGIAVIEHDIEFDADYVDDGRARPYRVLYTANGDIRLVPLNLSGVKARAGAQYGDIESIRRHAAKQGVVNDRRRPYPCNKCEDTWDVVCSEGVPSVCDPVGYGSPFSPEASDAVQLLCSTLGDACSGSLGNEACEGQCVGDEIDDDDHGDDDSGSAGVNACLDPASDLYKCEYIVGNPTMRLEECGLVDDDLPYLPGCFESFGKTNLNYLYFAYILEPTTNVFSSFPEDTFAGLTALIDLNIGFLGLTSVPEGLFSGLSKLKSLALNHNNLTSLPSGIFAGLVGVKYIHLNDNYLATLPNRVFEGCSSLRILIIDDNELVSLLAETFTGMGGHSLSVLMSGNNLTTLPDGLFIDIPRIISLCVERNPGLQCIPAFQGDGISFFMADPELGDIFNDSLCECRPDKAVMCQPGTVCEPGNKGYKCV